MTYLPNPSGKTWSECLQLLAENFDTWRVQHWAWTAPASNFPGRGRNHWAALDYADAGGAEAAAVTVQFVHPKKGDKTITVKRFTVPTDNLWAIWKGLEAIRLNELRGLDDIAEAFYPALPAPKQRRDPWEVLGLRPGADLDDVEAMYRSKAKRLHPDRGGTAEAMAELNEAYASIKPDGVKSA